MSLHLQDDDASLLLTTDAVQARTGWCQADVPLALAEGELPRLADGLQALYETGSGAFLWSNDGGEVRIEVAMAKQGETHWSVRLQAPPDFLHELRLVFVGRQDELTGLIEGL